jgi:hypothetical protein
VRANKAHGSVGKQKRSTEPRICPEGSAHLRLFTSTARGPRPSGWVTVKARDSRSREEGRCLHGRCMCVGWVGGG